MSVKVKQYTLTKGLAQKSNGNFQFRMSIAKVLRPVFNRTEFKKTYDINKNLTIKDILDDVFKIKNEYASIRDRFKMNVLTHEEIETLVNDFITDNLNEDYEARIDGSFGGTFRIFGGVDKSNEPIEDQTLDVMELVLSELKEDLSNTRKEFNDNLLRELLKKIDVSLDELDNSTRKELNYCFKQATIEILEEQISRSRLFTKAKRIKKDINQNTTSEDNQKKDSDTEPLTIKAAIKQYLEYYEQSNTNVSTKTYNEKVKALDYFLLVMENINVITTNDLKKSNIDLYVNKYLKNKPKQASSELRKLSLEDIIYGIDNGDFEGYDLIITNTVIKQYQHISGFCNHLFDDGIIDKKINKVTVSQELSNRDEFTIDEAKIILEVLKKDSLLCYQLFTVYLHSGLRNNELWQSEIKQDKNSKILYFDVKGTKSKNAVRSVPLHNKLIELGINQDWLIKLQEKYKDHKHTSRKINKIVKSLNEVDKSKILYCCRHTFTTELLKQGVDSNIVDKLTGHRNKKDLTINTYGKNAFTLDKLKEAVDKLVI